ncbi:MAG: ATP synthase F1 subunit epsilon [Clostridiales bacterium]|jgi:F-type H+-transporting ATPase subunit epsilon|nr:ATP synthase F1 subunit epsilon [Clostridiales bacterium]
MDKKIHLKIVTPIKTTLDAHVDMVIMQAIDGELGVLRGHVPLATILTSGVLRYYDDEKVGNIALFGGMAEINQKEVVVLADIAEKPEDIDAERARLAEERARRRLSEKMADLDEQRAKYALRKALVRQELTGKLTTVADKVE